MHTCMYVMYSNIYIIYAAIQVSESTPNVLPNALLFEYMYVSLLVLQLYSCSAVVVRLCIGQVNATELVNDIALRRRSLYA